MRAPARAMFLVILLSAQLAAAEGDWHAFVAPNKRHAVRLREGNAIGNCRYNQAQLIDARTGKLLLDFGPERSPSFDLGGYEEDSVVWAPDSLLVAVYLHSHRVGEPLVAMISGDTASSCTIPEVTLPHDKDPAIDGRRVQAWVKPIKWIANSTLLLRDSGLIQQQREGAFRIGYSYEIELQFDREGQGLLKSLKRREFTKERAD